jgi:hypothetical protein
VEQNDIVNNNLNGNKVNDKNIKCFASTAELLRPKKKSKVEELSTITLGYIYDKHPNKTEKKQCFRVLFDSGCSATLINKKFVKYWIKTEDKSVKWSTKAGSFNTKRRCDIEFTLPAFHENRNITCSAYVDESHHELCNYDMIIGRDLMHSLGINLLFNTAQISWDNAIIHMQAPETLKRDWIDALEKELLFAHDPDTTDAERIQDIIESKYCPADLNKIVEECTHLERAEQRQLLKLL